jgi:hypothetical protein
VHVEWRVRNLEEVYLNGTGGGGVDVRGELCRVLRAEGMQIFSCI